MTLTLVFRETDPVQGLITRREQTYLFHLAIETPSSHVVPKSLKGGV